MTFLALDILKSGVPFSMVCAVLGLLFAFFLIKAVIRLSPGNDRMRQIAGAIEEGAKIAGHDAAALGARDRERRRDRLHLGIGQPDMRPARRILPRPEKDCCRSRSFLRAVPPLCR